MVHISNTGADSVYSPGDTVCVDFTSTIFKGPGSEELPFKIPQVCTYESGSLALPPPPTGDDSDDGGSALAITAGVIGGIVGLIVLIALLLFCMKRRRSSPKQIAGKHVEMEEQGGNESSPYKNDNLSGQPLSVRVAGASQAAATGPNAV